MNQLNKDKLLINRLIIFVNNLVKICLPKVIFAFNTYNVSKYGDIYRDRSTYLRECIICAKQLFNVIMNIQFMFE